MAELQLDTVHLPLSKNGCKFMVVGYDTYSGYSFAFSTKTKANEEVIPLLLKEIFLKFGAPSTVVSDNGGDMTSKAYNDLYKRMGTKIILTSYFASRSNLCERLNKELVRTLRATTGEDTRNWPDILPEILYVLNNTPKSSLGNRTSSELFYGWKPNNPLIPCLNKLYFPDMPKSATEMLTRIYKNHILGQKIVHKFKQLHYKKTETSMQKQAKLQTFEIGDKVMLYSPTSKKSDKISSVQKVYIGPYDIMKTDGTNVTLRVPKTRQIFSKQTHINRLRKYIDSEDLTKLNPPIKMEEIPYDNIINDLTNQPYILEPELKLDQNPDYELLIHNKNKIKDQIYSKMTRDGKTSIESRDPKNKSKIEGTNDKSIINDK